MAFYIQKARVITELDPPVVITVNQPHFFKALTVNVRSGQAQVFLGPISGETVILEAGESLNFSALDPNDFLEPGMIITAIGPGASVLVSWAHL